MKVKIQKLSRYAIMPTYATPGAACFDLHAIESVMIRSKEQGIVSTGLAFEVPEGYVMLVYARSGLAFKNRVSLGNAVGVIDADYRGEVKIALRNDGVGFHEVLPGDRIAQAMIVPVKAITFVEAELSSTDRGVGGFGSTGK